MKGKKIGTNGKVEILLLRRIREKVWEALVKPSKSLKPGTVVDITIANRESKGVIKIIESKEDSIRIIELEDEELIYKSGEMPLPPYIHRSLENKERYQTVYARDEGSAAAPTAGLHFTNDLIKIIQRKGVIIAPVTLHIGLDTFQPVREEDPEKHVIHREFGTICQETVRQISMAKHEGRRVICVGTTATRMVEHAFRESFSIPQFSGWVDLFILPGFNFKITDAMITNFHLPKTTLIMLVSAFTGKEFILHTYTEAIKENYRFYSFGDAMLII